MMSITRENVIARSRADFEVPLGNSAYGKLMIISGVPGLSIDSDASMPQLLRADFEPPLPYVNAHNSTVKIRYPRYSLFNWLLYWRQPEASITINSLLPWSIEVHGGASGFNADLSQVQLSSLEIRGGVSHFWARLSAPTGTVPVRVSAASDMTIYHPATIPLRIQARKGIGSLTLDEQRFGSIAGQIPLETNGFDEVINRYDIRLSGGAGRISIQAL
jgi:hypothetical protein